MKIETKWRLLNFFGSGWITPFRLSVKIYRTEYCFRRVQHEGDIVHVLINTPEISLTQKSINNLIKSLNPVTVLNPGPDKNQQLMEEVLATNIDLAAVVYIFEHAIKQ